MAVSMKDSVHMPDADEMGYLRKIDWFWGRLTPSQRSRIESSISGHTLRQEHSRHCIIANAVGATHSEPAPQRNPFLAMAAGLANAIFYDGPNYEVLLGRKPAAEERALLDDIYYARIGGLEYQYKKANDLVRYYISGRMAAV